MGMRFSDRFARGGEGFADQAAQFEKQNIERDLRARLEKKRQDMELSRTNTLEQFNKTMTPEFMASGPSRADLANVYKSIGAHSIKHQDPSVGQSLKPIFDFLGGDIKADEDLEKAEAAALGKSAGRDWQRIKFERGEFKDNVKEIRKVNKDLRARSIDGIGVAPSAVIAKNIRTSTADKKVLDSQIQEIIDLRTKYGSEKIPSYAKSRMQDLAAKVLVTLKDVSKLGVMSDEDKKLLLKQIPEDPSSIFFFNALPRLKGLLGDVGARYEAELEANLEERWEPGRAFEPMAEPEWKGEGDSPVAHLTPKKKESELERINKIYDDPEKFNKLVPPEKIDAYRNDKANAPLLEAARNLHKSKHNGQEPTEEDINKFIGKRLLLKTKTGK